MIPQYLFLVIPLLTGLSEYETITTPYYDFFFTQGDGEAAAVLAEDSLPITDGVMADLGITLAGKISVYLSAPGHFDDAQPGGTTLPDSVTGVAYPHLSRMVLRSPRDFGSTQSQLRKTFIHELTHLLLGQAFARTEGVPRWLNEGLAMYQSREWHFDRVFTMTQAVLSRSLIPLNDLTAAFPRQEGERERAYCQSFYLIAFLVSEYGTPQLQNFIRAYAKEKVLEDVLLTTYGMNLYELERRWHRWLTLRFNWIPLITSSITLWFGIALIFLLSYLKKRRDVRVIVQNWEGE